MSYDFISDLDGYFCEKYEDYDRICVLNGYIMPQMQAVKRLKDGRDYAYTLPQKTMRLALQKNRESLLSQLKEKLVDTSFSFSFRPLGFWSRIKDKFNKRSFAKVFPVVLARKNLTVEEVGKALPISQNTYDRILKGRYYPTKNLLFSIGLSFALSDSDVAELLEVCGEGYDFCEPKDVVVAYLLTRGVANRGMIEAALEEYKIGNLFLSKEENA